MNVSDGPAEMEFGVRKGREIYLLASATAHNVGLGRLISAVVGDDPLPVERAEAVTDWWEDTAPVLRNRLARDRSPAAPSRPPC